MSDPVAVAIVSVFGTIVTGVLTLIGVLVNRTRQHAKATRHQTENDHKTNLRVELDERHGELMRALEGVRSDIRGVRRDVGRNTDELHAHEIRLDELERSDLRRSSIYESGIPTAGG